MQRNQTMESAENGTVNLRLGQEEQAHHLGR